MSKFNYAIYDIECYNNYSLAVIVDPITEKFIEIDTRMTRKEQVKKFMSLTDKIMVGFNSNRYDSVIVELWNTLLLEGYSNSEIEKILKRASDMIVKEDLYGWKVFRELNIENGSYFNHLDLTDGYLKIGTLKEVGIRLHHDILEFTPTDFEKDIEDSDIPSIIHYCTNDVMITLKMFRRKFNEVEAKEVLIENFGLDLDAFSKTNRRIAEDILCGRGRSKGSDVCDYREPKFRLTGKQFRYNFEDDDLNNLLLTYTGNIIPDRTKFQRTVNIGGLDCDFGLGGIHGSVTKYIKPDDKQIIDVDVASHYPFMMKLYDFIPEGIKDPEAFFEMIDDRIANKRKAGQLKKQVKRARKEGRSEDADRLQKQADHYKDLAWAQKIVINTVYGASGLPSSKFYDVQARYSVTITGQLTIAKLMEMLSLGGYKLIYGNTDGIMFEADIDDDGTRWKAICKEWEEVTGLELEFNKVTRLFLRDVSNYMVETEVEYENEETGELEIAYDRKNIGVYNLKALNKNEGHQRIVKTAIDKLLFDDIPMEETILNCNEVTEFTMYQKYSKQYDPIVIKNLYGDKEELAVDRVVRYVYSPTNQNVLKGRNNNNENESWTERASNIEPVADLKQLKIEDIDRERYILDAYDELAKLLGDHVYQVGNKKLNKLLFKCLEADLSKDQLTVGIGKMKLKSKYDMDPWRDIRHNSIQVWTGPRSNILVLDVDQPEATKSKQLTKMIKETGWENYAISHSSQYTIEDVLNNRCNYKLIFQYDGKTRIPKKKKNKDIELFYNNTQVAILGDRGDGYDYILTGEVPVIDFDVNDFLQAEVKFKFLELDRAKK